MRREIKIGKFWLGVNELETILKLLRNQETTDKDDIGMYVLSDNDYDIRYRIDSNYDVIIDRIEWV